MTPARSLGRAAPPPEAAVPRRPRGANEPALLQNLGELGIAGLGQLARRYWPTAPLRRVRLRLARLARAGLLAAYPDPEYGRIYCLTAAGHAVLPYGVPGHYQIGVPPAATRRQQLLLQDVYDALSAAACARGEALAYWRSEQELRKLHAGWEAGRVVPDAQVVCRRADGSCYVLNLEIDDGYHGPALQRKLAALGPAPHPTLWYCAPARCAVVAEAAQPYPRVEVRPFPTAQPLGRGAAADLER